MNVNTRQPRPDVASRSAFTLIEMVLATAIIAVVLLGMQSATMLAARTAPDRGGANMCALNAGRAADQLATDLAYASSITNSSANTIEFTVPDRTGDSVAETIRYSWSGVAGEPLLRTFNGHASTTALSNVREFQLTFDKVSTARATSYTDSGEVLLYSYDGASLPFLTDYKITSSQACAQYFTPNLPSGATRFHVTRVLVKAKQAGVAAATLRVQLTNSGSTLPTTVLDEADLLESSLPTSYGWVTASLSGSWTCPAGSSICVVFKTDSSTDAGYIQHQAAWGSSSAIFVTSSDGGNSWATTYQQDMPFYVYGTCSTTNAAAYDYWLKDVRCTVRSGSDTTARVRTTIRMFNQPQVSGP